MSEKTAQLPMNTGENKRKHLEMIQGVINRLADNSFSIKGWAAMLVAAIFGLAVATSNENPNLFYVAFVPVTPLWVLDAYFLYQERLFRSLYSSVCKKDEGEIDFAMDAMSFRGGRNTWLRAFVSVTLLIFYASLILMTIIVILYLPARVAG